MYPVVRGLSGRFREKRARPMGGRAYVGRGWDTNGEVQKDCPNSDAFGYPKKPKRWRLQHKQCCQLEAKVIFLELVGRAT